MSRTICFQHESTKEDYTYHVEIAVRESKEVFVGATLFDRINDLKVAEYSAIPSWHQLCLDIRDSRQWFYHELVLFEPGPQVLALE